MRKRVRALRYTVRIFANKKNCIKGRSYSTSPFGYFPLAALTQFLHRVLHQHVLVPRIWVFSAFERAESAGLRSCHGRDDKRAFPLAVHLAFLFGLRYSSKRQISLFDVSGLHFLVLPPSCLFLILAQVDYCLHLACFDRVDRRPHVYFNIVYPFGYSPGFEFDFLVCYSFFAI